jgi:hypothetical protein
VPFFHVTFDRHIPSILKHGLGGRITEQNFPGCEAGVYLATDHAIGLVMLIAEMMEREDDSVSPKNWIASVRVIVVDDTRVNPKLLSIDESFPDSALIKRYEGVIDVTGMPILDIDQAMPAEFRPGGEKYREIDAAVND